MQSFRTELENQIVQKDIIELEKKIYAFKFGKIDEDKFRSLRLARGVYGQRQPGVQMVRIKIPYGKVTTQQLLKLADISDEYASGNLHITTRQDVQIHYVSLDKTPELWQKLEASDITLREACGNTVRNITASELAGIDVNEPFNVVPYADALFRYFLRNPVANDLGRKFKIAFASSENDEVITAINDLGFIPVLKGNQRGFKVIIGGGLGAQPFHGIAVFDFLPDHKIIPFTEALLRVFDRLGERNNRNKARLKHLVQKIGTEELLHLVNEERLGLKQVSYPVDYQRYVQPESNVGPDKFIQTEVDGNFQKWKLTNVIDQKQLGFYAVRIKVKTGDIDTAKVRELARLVDEVAANDIRFTIGQGILLRFVKSWHLPYLYNQLQRLGLAEPGAQSTADVTACPGTDTCNLGISNSTGIAGVLEDLVYSEFPELIEDQNFKIKISGCMNACGQHAIATFGLHGSSIKKDNLVIPALQVLLGGHLTGNGEVKFAEKVIKVPSKRVPQVFRSIIVDFKSGAYQQELFHEYFVRKGKRYFFDLLKDFADVSEINDSELIDWGHSTAYIQQIGIGECAGVKLDLVETLFFESEERLEKMEEAFEWKRYADAVYHGYKAVINSAKALLLTQGIASNSEASVINLFEEHFGSVSKFKSDRLRNTLGLIRYEKPTETFAISYIEKIKLLHQAIVAHKRTAEIV